MKGPPGFFFMGRQSAPIKSFQLVEIAFGCKTSPDHNPIKQLRLLKRLQCPQGFPIAILWTRQCLKSKETTNQTPEEDKISNANLGHPQQISDFQTSNRLATLFAAFASLPTWKSHQYSYSCTHFHSLSKTRPFYGYYDT